MENLIKPVDYAAKMGISRQAVYAKIKKGILPSKNVDGKIYIVLDEEESKAEERNRPDVPEESARRLLDAKDETISVLKETIRDLKETNRMITSTLRSEVELLKEAFSEMKTLYAAQIEHIRSDEAIPVAEIGMEEPLSATVSEEVVEGGKNPEADSQIDREWIPLDELLSEQGIGKKKKRRLVLEVVERYYRKGKKGIRKEDGEYFLTPERAAKVLRKALERKES
ncbi:DUF3972 domain-containing protein [Nitratifractor sp.]